jgi:hypothetical protein
MVPKQRELFGEKNASINSGINGLAYIPDFIPPQEEVDLIQIIDAQTWLADLKRRVQRYGKCLR